MHFRIEKYRDPEFTQPDLTIGQLAFVGGCSVFLMMSTIVLAMGMGLSAPDFAAAFGAFFNHGVQPEMGSVPWFFGFCCYIATASVVFPLIFQNLRRRLSLHKPWAAGAFFGVLLWVFFQVIVEPFAGGGVFSSQLPYAGWISSISLIGWLVYGISLDEVGRVPEGAAHGFRPQRAA